MEQMWKAVGVTLPGPGRMVERNLPDEDAKRTRRRSGRG
jgi:hypothetical protein